MMNRYALSLFVFMAIWLFATPDALSQKKKPVKKPAQKTQSQKSTTQKSTSTQTQQPAKNTDRNISEDKKRVKEIIDFLQYVLNTLGSSATSARDKEVLVTQSYAKIFRDGKVQVEDDLDEERLVVTNKDVVPYLKDVDFFFRDVKFEFVIEDVKNSKLPDGDIFYKVSARRILTGTTTDGAPVANTIPRFIEINYDPGNQDLRIVSMYTHEINETEVLKNWWRDLSLEWQTLLRSKLPATSSTDSLSLSDLKAITSTTELDLSNNKYIQSAEPLERLKDLRFLNLSGTVINDLAPIRNLTELQNLNLERTPVTDISPLKYANKLTSLNINHTLVSDITVIEKMPALQNLEMRRTPVSDYSPLTGLTLLQKLDISSSALKDLVFTGGLTGLTTLDISGTSVRDLGPLRNLRQLQRLDIDSTQVVSLEPLNGMESLTELHANNTAVTDLTSLQKSVRLAKIYADNTAINRDAVNRFNTHSKAEVIFESGDLKNWWNALSPEWQTIFSTAAMVHTSPSKEELSRISNLDSVNIAGRNIITLEPLRKLPKLKAVIAPNTGIRDLSPFGEHTDILYLDISGTAVSDLTPLAKLTKLKVLRADKSKIENIERYSFPALELLYADQTALHDITAREFLEKNPECLLIYKTIHINRWWNNLSESWRNVFSEKLKNDTTREAFHRLLEQEKFEFIGPVRDLDAIAEFVQLKELHFSGTSITRIPRIENLQSLTSLHATNSPIREIAAGALPATLQDLDISNTPIDDLKLIGSLPALRKLNCSGTQIRRLDHLEKIASLENLDCSNTNVARLEPLDALSLKTLTCYNTKISSRTIDNFKSKHPDCQVVYYR